jgi:hypothetical protein
MGFWSINPYIGCAFGCAYCYARYTHRYVMERAATDEKMTETLGEAYNRLPPWLAFERNIFVKKNAPEVLSRTLRFGSDRHLKLLQGETIVIGTATDPYQPAERRFRVTRGLLEVLAEHPGLSVAIITKSPLITRDIDLLSRINRHSELSVHISLITLDRELARRIEPRAPTPESRVRALARLRDLCRCVRGTTPVSRTQTLSPVHRAGISAFGGAVPQHLWVELQRRQEISRRPGALLREALRQVRSARLVTQYRGRRRGRDA